MKKIVVLIGSRSKKGNTATFVRRILSDLPENGFEIEYLFPQDFQISPCLGCQQCFIRARCVQKDELNLLQEKILSADVFVIASPVYLHYMTADLKLILEKSSWWAHTLRLQGKPVVVLSTCGTNGHNTVIEPLSQIMNFMGGNVIAKSNAAQVPSQMDNENWLKGVADEINRRIIKYSDMPPQSNDLLEKIFYSAKWSMQKQEEVFKNVEIEKGELNYWQKTGMINFDTFGEYLASTYKKFVIVN